MNKDKDVSHLWESIIEGIGRNYGGVGGTPTWEDPYKVVSEAIHDFLWELAEDRDKRIEFMHKNDLNLADQIRLHRMIQTLYEVGRTGETDKLVELLQARIRET